MLTNIVEPINYQKTENQRNFENKEKPKEGYSKVTLFIPL